MDIREIEGKRIAVLLSGGVDSSVVVYEFARLGLHPDCFYIKIGPEEEEEWDCSSEEDLEMASSSEPSMRSGDMTMTSLPQATMPRRRSAPTPLKEGSSGSVLPLTR